LTGKLLEHEPGRAFEPELIGNLKTDVFYVPEFYSQSQHAGRSDPGVPRQKLGQINGSTDLRAAVEKFATIPGAYYAESRAGRDVLDSKVFHHQPGAQAATMREPQARETYAPRRYERRDHFGRARYASPRRRPYRPAPRVVETPSHVDVHQEVQQQVNAMLTMMREAEERGAARVRESIPVGHVDRIDRVDSPAETPALFLNKIAYELAKNGDRDAALALVGGGNDEREPRGTLAQLADVAIQNPEMTQQFIGGILGYAMPLLSAFLPNSPSASPQGQPTQPATPATPAQTVNILPPSVRAALDVVEMGMLRDDEVDDACAAIQDLLTMSPAYRSLLGQILNKAPTEAVYMLAAIPGYEHLRRLKGADSFMRDLQSAIREGQQAAAQEKSEQESEDAGEAQQPAEPSIVQMASERAS